MLPNKKKKKSGNDNRLLISVSVIGSSGPIRLVVGEKDPVAAVIESALKLFAREERLPVLGSNLDDFLLYCSAGESRAMNPRERIGSQGARKFLLFKKPLEARAKEDGESMEAAKKSNGGWKSWLHKSIHIKISTH